MLDSSPRAVRARARFPLLLIATAFAACSGADPAPRIPLNAQRPATASAGDSGGPALSAAARAALDSGNVQYRAKRYADALASYRAASRAAPGHVAPEFGIYMAAKELGNRAVADSAQRIIAAHSAGSPMWTDSAMQRAHSGQASAPALPPTHPRIAPP